MKWSYYFHYIEQIGSRYFMVAAIFFLLFYVLLHNKWFYKKIQRKVPSFNDYAREIGYSILTIAIFAFVPLFVLHYPAISKHTFYYKSIDQYGWLYFVLAFPL